MEFSSDLYSPVAVERAVATFGELAKFEVTHGESAIAVSYDEVDPDVADVLEDELANFVLNETILLNRAPSSMLR